MNLPKHLATKTYHHNIQARKNSLEYMWEENETIPFDELIISWNAMRPQQGRFDIETSIKSHSANWSSWYPYASWGDGIQCGGNIPATMTSNIKVEQDILSILNSEVASSFRIRIRATDGATLNDVYSLHACTTRLVDFESTFSEDFTSAVSKINLDVPLTSQLKLSHARSRDMCSPTSTTAVVRYLSSQKIDPITFATMAKDETFDIYGNWVLNTAHASSLLGGFWRCWVQRLQGLGEIFQQLQRGIPVVVSVKGPLPGSYLPYTQGHLLVVKGYDMDAKQVLCMDPAFPQDNETDVKYALNDFLKAWSRRQRIAYMVSKPENQ